jgi:gamma-D-glutamyl-L-lysine dipeptidyl-peptidase
MKSSDKAKVTLHIHQPVFNLQHAVVHLACVPLRAEPSDRSEMTNQLLFGDLVEVMESKDKWTRVKSTYDGYTGWMNPRQTVSLAVGEFELYNTNDAWLVNDTVALAEANGSVQILPMGATLPFYDGGKFRIGNSNYTLHGNASNATETKLNEENIQLNALRLLNAPYLWGGKTVFGIDCSGFTQVVFKLLGINLKRDAYQQAEQGRAVSLIDQGQCGDLAFFHNDAGKIVHVGILLDNKTIIHSSGQVRIDRIDHQGIFNAERKAYTHHLKLIKRLV